MATKRNVDSTPLKNVSREHISGRMSWRLQIWKEKKGEKNLQNTKPEEVRKLSDKVNK